MLVKIKRLIFKPFGGKANLISTLIITIIGYLFVRTYLFSSYTSGVENRLDGKEISCILNIYKNNFQLF
jgi:hypothetical protein